MTPPPTPPPRGAAYRLPAGLGCLLPLVALPIALLALAWAGVRGLLAGRSARRVHVAQTPVETALHSLVRKMAIDATFTLDEARMAGVPADAGATVDQLLQTGVARGYFRERDDEFEVTEEGRGAADAYEARYGLE